MPGMAQWYAKFPFKNFQCIPVIPSLCFQPFTSLILAPPASSSLLFPLMSSSLVLCGCLILAPLSWEWFFLDPRGQTLSSTAKKQAIQARERSCFPGSLVEASRSAKSQEFQHRYVQANNLSCFQQLPENLTINPSYRERICPNPFVQQQWTLVSICGIIILPKLPSEFSHILLIKRKKKKKVS